MPVAITVVLQCLHVGTVRCVYMYVSGYSHRIAQHTQSNFTLALRAAVNSANSCATILAVYIICCVCTCMYTQVLEDRPQEPVGLEYITATGEREPLTDVST
jgi:hypothetical protein